MKILSSFTYFQVVLHLCEFLSSVKHNLKNVGNQTTVPIDCHLFFHIMEVNEDQQLYERNKCLCYSVTHIQCWGKLL